MHLSESNILGYLPGFCVPRVLFRAILAALLLAVILALTAADNPQAFFMQLALHTVFVLWVVLASLLTVCVINRLYEEPPSVTSSAVIVLLIVAVFTLVASLLGMVANNNQSNAGEPWFDVLFLLKNLVISVVITLAVLRYFFIQNQWQHTVQADSVAKYDALQSRMRPHFLFNSLNTVAHLVHSDPDRAEDAILDLADIMRTTLDKRSRISLQEELDLTMRYLRMEILRLGKRRLTVVWDMNRNTLPFDMEVLPLILQPLVENAIYHGIQPRKDGGTLGVSLYDAGDRLVVSVTNPLPPTNANTHQKGNHIAQENMKKRLSLAYGDRANLQIQKTEQQYRVSFAIPKE